MSELLAAMEQYFVRIEWKYQQESDDRLKFGIKGTNGSYGGVALFRDPKVSVYFSIPYNIPENKRMAVTEYICRANFGLFFGNLELDLRDGEVRYKTILKWDEAGTPSDKTLESLIFINANTLDRYFPGINAIVYGNIPPQKALEDVESNNG